MTAILGISGLYHDSAAALIVDGEVIAAVQEERFTRIKHDSSYPEKAIAYVLSEGGLTLDQVDYVAFYDKPFLKFERLLETYVALAPKGLKSFLMAVPIWLREKLFLKDLIIKKLRDLDENFAEDKLLFGEHHLSHAASAFYPSPFEEAVILVLDGVGEWATTTVAIGKGNKLEIVKEIHFPHSLGLLYSAFTYYIGFRVNSGEYKLMGLAPYGTPKYKNIILEKIVDLKEDGSFRLEQSYFNYAAGLTMTNKKFSDLFGQPVRQPDIDEITQFHMDVAASIQAVTEEIVLKMTSSLAEEYGIPNLCMAGGVALNCVANGKILRAKSFEDIWIQPAAGDAGGALGVALAVWHKELEMSRTVNPEDSMKGSYLGPGFEDNEIVNELNGCGAIYDVVSNEQMIDITAEALVDGKAIGWFQGRMEYGPRALGARSIISDPRSESMQKTLNLKVKYRESFRPFAPSVLCEEISNWFSLDSESPYMLIVADVKKEHLCDLSESDKDLFGIDKINVKRSIIPAVTHVDYTARVQSVSENKSPLYHALINKFYELTGVPMLVNTSFNIRGEPIVCSPTDAYSCFMGTELDMLVCGNVVLWKDKQGSKTVSDYRSKYKLD